MALYSMYVRIQYPYISISWTVIIAAEGEFIFILCENVSTEEFVEYGDECPSIPVVSDTPTIVTLPREVGHSSKWNVL